MAKIRFLKKLDNYLGRILCSVLPTAGTPQNRKIEKVLLIRPGGIGDAVLLVPTIKLLCVDFPEIQIDILAEKRNSGIFDLVPEVRRVIHYDSILDLLRIFFRSYDAVIDTEQWHRLSAVVARVVRSRMRVGFGTNERKKMFSHLVGYSHDDYEAESFIHLLEPLGVNVSSPIETVFLQAPNSVKQRAADLTSYLQSKPYVVIFPGASIPERQWGVAKFTELASRIADTGLGVVVVGGNEDKLSGDAIVKDIEYGLNLAGCCNLAVSAGIIDGARLLISGDSGILHIGVGLGKPTVSIFGPGIARKWAPRGEQHRVVNNDIDCSPCTSFGNTPKCPIDVKCLKDISVDEVYGAAIELLEIEG